MITSRILRRKDIKLLDIFYNIGIDALQCAGLEPWRSKALIYQ